MPLGRYLLRYPLTLVCVTAIWVLCLVSTPQTPLSGVAGIDKWTHVVMFGGTCGVMWWEYLRSHRGLNPWRLVLWAVVAPVLMGGAVELVQAYATTSRSGDWADFVADAIGVVLAAALGYGVMRPLMERRRRGGSTERKQ